MAVAAAIPVRIFAEIGGREGEPPERESLILVSTIEVPVTFTLSTDQKAEPPRESLAVDDKLRTITTREELDALAEGSVIVSTDLFDNDVLQHIHYRGGPLVWFCASGPHTVENPHLPVYVIWDGKEPGA